MQLSARSFGRMAPWAVIAFVLAAPSFAVADAITLRLGNVTSPKHAQTKRDEMFAKLVEQKTGGQVKIQVFPAGQLGKAQAELQGTMSGTQDLFGGTVNYAGNFQEDWRVTSVYYVFNSQPHIAAFAKSDLFEEMNNRLAAKSGMRVLDVAPLRAPSTFIAKVPLLTVADFKGKKVRIPGIEGYAKSLKGLGATPTPVAWGDTYVAFSQGVIDVVQSSMEGIRSQKFTDFAKYILNSSHNWEPTGIFINEKSWQKLNSAQKKAMREAAQEASAYTWKVAMEGDVELRQTLIGRGATILDADPTPFRNRILNVLVPQLEKEKFWTIPGLFQKIQALDPASKKS